MRYGKLLVVVLLQVRLAALLLRRKIGLLVEDEWLLLGLLLAQVFVVLLNLRLHLKLFIIASHLRMEHVVTLVVLGIVRLINSLDGL